MFRDVSLRTAIPSSKSTRHSLLSSSSLSVLTIMVFATGTTVAQAANYMVSSEAEFISAINSIASDGDPDGTITLTNDVTISAASTIPSANKNLTIDTTGGYNLTVNADMPHANTLAKTGDGSLTFNGQDGPQGRFTLSDGTVIFRGGAQNGGGPGSRFYVGLDDDSTTNLIVSGVGTYVQAGVGSGFSGGSNVTTFILVEDGGTLNAFSTTGIGSQTVGTGGSTNVEVTGQGSHFQTGRLSSGFRGTVSYSILDGGSMATGTTDLGGNAVNAGLGDHVLISGTGSSWSSSGVFQFHDGSLAILDGGALSANELRIAPSGGRQVDAIVSGESSSISTTTGNVSLGGSTGTYDSIGTLTVSNGAVVSSMGGGGDILLGTGAQGTGILNIGAAASNPATAAGNVNAANIVLGGGSATVNFNHINSNYTFGSTIAGNGIVNHTGSGTTVLSNANTYSGDTNVRNGVLRAGGTSAFSAASDYTVNANGMLDLDDFDQTLASLNNAGSVFLGISPGTTLYIAGDYVGNAGNVEISTALDGDSSATDLLHVGGDTSGTTSLKVTNAGGAGAQTVEGIKVVQVDGASNGTFSLQGDFVFQGEQAVVAGAYSYGLYKNGVSTPADGDWYLRSILDLSGTPVFQPGVSVYESYAGTLQSFNSISTLQQRVGNRSWSKTADVTDTGLIEGRGLWARVIGGHADYDPKVSTSQAKYDTDTWTFQIGADDVLYEGASGKLVGGISLHYGAIAGDIRTPFSNGGISSTGYGLGGALTWYSDTGFYLDGQARASWYDSDLSSSTAGSELISSNDGFGYAASLEVGQQFDLRSNWSITPQAQVVYSAVDFDNFVDTFGATVSLDESRSVKTRLGISADYQKLDTVSNSRTHIYGIANLYYDFADGSATNVSGVKLASENQSLWGGIGAGASHNWQDDKYSIYGQVEVKTSLDDFGGSSSISGTIGMRMSW